MNSYWDEVAVLADIEKGQDLTRKQNTGPSLHFIFFSFNSVYFNLTTWLMKFSKSLLLCCFLWLEETTGNPNKTLEVTLQWTRNPWSWNRNTGGSFILQKSGRENLICFLRFVFFFQIILRTKLDLQMMRMICWASSRSWAVWVAILTYSTCLVHVQLKVRTVTASVELIQLGKWSVNLNRVKSKYM